MIGTIAVAVVVYLKDKKVRMVQNELSQYETLKESDESGKHQKLEEEIYDNKGVSSSQAELYSGEDPSPQKRKAKPEAGSTKELKEISE